MSLVSVVQSAANSAISAIGDLATTMTYTSVDVSGGTYNPVTDSYSGSSPTVLTNVPCVLAKFRTMELDGSIIELTDLKCVVVSSKLPSVTPKNADTITSGGDTYEVVRFLSVPGDAVYLLHVRRVGS